MDIDSYINNFKMQFPTTNDEIYILLNSVRRGDRVVIIPTRTDTDSKGWDDAPDSSACIRGDESIHLLVSYIDCGIILDEDDNQIMFGDPAFPENDPDNYPNESTYYILDSYLMNEGTNITWSKRFRLVADFIKETNRWKIRLDVYNNVKDYRQVDMVSMYPSICKIMLCSGTPSVIPVLCATACAKRSTKIEKATFAAVLARRFGNTLANDLTQMMFPEIDNCISKHSLLDYV